MKIYLIRHGKTLANEQRLYCGSTDIDLSDTGVSELCKLKYDIGDVKFITSGMRRTDQTLRLLFGDVPFTAEPRFREVDFGIFEMHGYEQLKSTAEYQLWLAGNNEKNVPPLGESGEQMRKRALRAFAEQTQDCCIITHGGVIAAIMEHLFPDEHKSRYQWQPQPGHGYIVSDGRYAPIP